MASRSYVGFALRWDFLAYYLPIVSKIHKRTSKFLELHIMKNSCEFQSFFEQKQVSFNHTFAQTLLSPFIVEYWKFDDFQ